MVGWLETFSVADLFGRCFGGKTKAPGKDGDAPVPILEAEENPKQRLSIEVTIYFILFLIYLFVL
jgi:hypothetical protein